MALRCKSITWPCQTVTEQAQFDAVQVATSGGTVFADEKTDAGDSGTADIPLGTAVGDAVYFGCTSDQFDAIWIQTSTNASGGTRVWEYWNGSSWATLTHTNNTGADLLSSSTQSFWTRPSDWATTTVNSISAYWIRIRTTVLHTNGGTLSVACPARRHTLASETVHLPETTSRTFRSVYLRIWPQSPIQAQTALLRVGITVGAGAAADVLSNTTRGSIASPGETATFPVLVDLTSQFTTNFTGASHTVTITAAWLQETVMATVDQNWRNWTCELVATYEYDDTDATQANTVILPIDSLTGDLTTSLQTIGGAGGIPILTGASGILREAGITIRAVGILWEFNSVEGGTTNWDFRCALDAAGEVTVANINAANDSDTYMRLCRREDAIDTTSAHDLKARVTSLTGAVCSCVGARLVVTYTYDESSSTERTVTLTRPWTQSDGFYGGTTLALQDRQLLTFHIPDDTPVLRQSGVVLYHHSSADIGSLVVGCGTQTKRTYGTQETNVSGPVVIHHRFDSGAVAGSGGIGFGRGEIPLAIESRANTTPTNGAGLSGVVFLTYSYTITSGKRTSSCSFLLRPTDIALGLGGAQSFAVPIPEAAPWLSHVGAVVTELNGATGQLPRVQVNIGTDLGWYATHAMFIRIDGTTAARFACYDFGRWFRRRTDDYDATRIDIETSRTWSVDGASGQTRAACEVVAAWHDYTWTVGGNISGSAGGDVNINVLRADTGERVANTFRTGDGAYSVTVYDDTILHTVEAREDSTHVGRSDDDYPT